MNTKTKLMESMYSEDLALDLDRACKDLLDGADRLTWGPSQSIKDIDRWIDTTNAALARLRAARMDRVRTERIV